MMSPQQSLALSKTVPSSNTLFIRHFSSGPRQASSNKAAVPMLLIVGGAFVAWSASEFLFDNQQTSKNESLRQEFEQWMRTTSHDIGTTQEQPILYCVIRRADGWNVTHCLSGAQVGDVVEVLQESVGPNREYNLCRLYRENSQQHQEQAVLGWFPIRWLQPLDDYDRMLQKQLEQLQKEEE
jgi:hypothetical protein